MPICRHCRRDLPAESFSPGEKRGWCRECRRDARQRSLAGAVAGLGVSRRRVYLNRHHDYVRDYAAERRTRTVSLVPGLCDAQVLRAQQLGLFHLYDCYQLPRSPVEILESRELELSDMEIFVPR